MRYSANWTDGVPVEVSQLSSSPAGTASVTRFIHTELVNVRLTDRHGLRATDHLQLELDQTSLVTIASTSR